MTTYELLVVEGSEQMWRGFVDGWAAGRGISAVDRVLGLVWPRDWHLQIPERLRGHALLITSNWADACIDALAASGLDLRLGARRDVTGARYEFDFSILSATGAAEVQALFAVPPVGVHMENYEVETRIDPEAVGVERHGGAHDYELRGGGVAIGGVSGVLELVERARRHERIRSRALTLELAP